MLLKELLSLPNHLEIEDTSADPEVLPNEFLFEAVASFAELRLPEDPLLLTMENLLDLGVTRAFQLGVLNEALVKDYCIRRSLIEIQIFLPTTSYSHPFRYLSEVSE